ncbi:Carbohydrate kinase, FGGY [Thalassoporum mexicanum PCC 7367]|uniref:FGGY-family carbohydrate kinase n=1 Tax=Thalassoporum mexicanum TaxID=3457544 RepID=UPI00029FF9A1|nr:FGGY-family carbohydrate kinase [Pseudanabaena sp. PCC 7367]AFY71129.1 Carbohydrate kinase, FGGY [Pseudanabaena sp. PCC 7367]
MDLYLGIDFGTSGARAIAIDQAGKIRATQKLNYNINAAISWRDSLYALIVALPIEIRQNINAIAIDATSATVLIGDRDGKPIGEPILYHDPRGASSLEKLRQIVPDREHLVLSATSSLAKLVWWLAHNSQSQPEAYLMHQADWLAYWLHGRLGVSDYNNTLKLGYDAERLQYPDWLEDWRSQHAPRIYLPKVVAPGKAIGKILPEVAAKLDLNRDCLVCAGTTDSTAAFLACLGNEPPKAGIAVTSLGSTLTIKVLANRPIANLASGIYSHRLGDLWLVGGASNTGGAVLRQFFSDAELQAYSDRINPDIPSPLDYYPLPAQGDRFPINDPLLEPRLEPRPTDPAAFLNGLLEGIAAIEALGYNVLAELGAQATLVYTAGGGAQNQTWRRIRARKLGLPIVVAAQTEFSFGAAYGAAILALQGAGV